MQYSNKYQLFSYIFVNKINDYNTLFVVDLNNVEKFLKL